jgi:hypothetical protein
VGFNREGAVVRADVFSAAQATIDRGGGMRDRARHHSGGARRGRDADARTGRPSVDADAVEHEDDELQWLADGEDLDEADGRVGGPGAGRSAPRCAGRRAADI